MQKDVRGKNWGLHQYEQDCQATHRKGLHWNSNKQGLQNCKMTYIKQYTPNNQGGAQGETYVFTTKGTVGYQ